MYDDDMLVPENGSWDGRYIHGVTAEEVEHILLIKLPDRLFVNNFTAGYKTEEASGGLRSDSLMEFIDNAFEWSTSPEGTDYWLGISADAFRIDSVEAVRKFRRDKDLFERGLI